MRTHQRKYWSRYNLQLHGDNTELTWCYIVCKFREFHQRTPEKR